MSYAALQPGDTVAVVAPAGPADPERVARVADLYAHFGLQARVYPGCHRRTGYLAGSDKERLADLHVALADPTVKALHALRGGYGCMRLLPLVNAEAVRRAGKLLVGYSDLTALQALWCLQGLSSLHAPMAASDMLVAGGTADEAGSRVADRDALFQLLMSPLPAGSVLAPPLQPAPRQQGLHASGAARGRLVGGNLSLVAALLGTPWAWPLNAPEGTLLFLEDVNEEPYRVDRLLTQLKLAGVLDGAAGFVLGSFTEEASPDTLLREMLLPLCQAQGKPLLAGWPSGHGTPNRPLPLGLTLQLDADAGTLTLLQDFLR